MNKNVWQIPNKRERVKSSVWCDQYDRGREVQEAQTDPIYKMRKKITGHFSPEIEKESRGAMNRSRKHAGQES